MNTPEKIVTPVSQKTIELHLLKQVAACRGMELSDEQATAAMMAAIRSELRQIDDQIFANEYQHKSLIREREALEKKLETYK